LHIQKNLVENSLKLKNLSILHNKKDSSKKLLTDKLATVPYDRINPNINDVKFVQYCMTCSNNNFINIPNSKLNVHDKRTDSIFLTNQEIVGDQIVGKKCSKLYESRIDRIDDGLKIKSYSDTSQYYPEIIIKPNLRKAKSEIKSEIIKASKTWLQNHDTLKKSNNVSLLSPNKEEYKKTNKTIEKTVKNSENLRKKTSKSNFIEASKLLRYSFTNFFKKNKKEMEMEFL
jgi:type III secretory pathway component EscV